METLAGLLDSDASFEGAWGMFEVRTHGRQTLAGEPGASGKEAGDVLGWSMCSLPVLTPLRTLFF